MRVTVAFTILSLSVAAVIGAMTMSESTWAVPALWVSAAMLAALSSALFLWPWLRRLRLRWPLTYQAVNKEPSETRPADTAEFVDIPASLPEHPAQEASIDSAHRAHLLRWLTLWQEACGKLHSLFERESRGAQLKPEPIPLLEILAREHVIRPYVDFNNELDKEEGRLHSRSSSISVSDGDRIEELLNRSTDYYIDLATIFSRSISFLTRPNIRASPEYRAVHRTAEELAAELHNLRFVHREHGVQAAKIRKYLPPPGNAQTMPRTTDQGIRWRMVSRKLREDDNRALATLRIEPVGELPQPLHIFIECEARISSFSAELIPDPKRPEDTENAQVELDAPNGDRLLMLCLRAPKLLGPACLDVNLVSAGNADIRVLSVTRMLAEASGQD